MSEENKNPLIEAFLRAHNHKQLNEAGGVNLSKARSLSNQPTNPPGSVVKSKSGTPNNVLKDKSTMDAPSLASKIATQRKIASGEYKSASSAQPSGTINPEPGNYTVNKYLDKAEVFARKATGDIGDVVGLTNPERGEALAKFNPKAAEAGNLANVASVLLPGRGALGAAGKAAGAGAEAKASSGVPKIAASGTSKPGPHSVSGPWGVIGQRPGWAPSQTKTGFDILKNIEKDVTAGKVKPVGEVPAASKPAAGAPKPASAVAPKPATTPTSKLAKAGTIAAGVGVGLGVGLTGNSKPAGEVQAQKEPAAAPKPAEAPPKYSVAKGETLSGIAQKNKISVADLLKANQNIKDVNKIGIGQQLNIPKSTGNPVYQGGIGTKSGPKLSQNIQKPKLKEETVENKLIGAFLELQSKQHSNIFEAAKKIKKLDPVGKEDEDIDNDGDKDKSDSYLHNRRKAIAKAMKEAKQDPYGELDAPVSGGKAPATTTNPDYAKKKPATQTPNRAEKGSLPKGVTVKGNTNEEVEFSEAELAHIAAILEANPVAPVPDDYSGAVGGVSKRDLSDETVAEAKRKPLKGNKFRSK